MKRWAASVSILLGKRRLRIESMAALYRLLPTAGGFWWKSPRRMMCLLPKIWLGLSVGKARLRTVLMAHSIHVLHIEISSIRMISMSFRSSRTFSYCCLVGVNGCWYWFSSFRYGILMSLCMVLPLGRCVAAAPVSAVEEALVEVGNWAMALISASANHVLPLPGSP